MPRSIIQYLEEGRGAGYTAAVLSGLGGVYTGGGAAGHYQSKKAEAARRELDKREGKLNMYDSDRTGRHMLAGLGGSIPLAGIVPNL